MAYQPSTQQLLQQAVDLTAKLEGLTALRNRLATMRRATPVDLELNIHGILRLRPDQSTVGIQYAIALRQNELTQALVNIVDQLEPAEAEPEDLPEPKSKSTIPLAPRPVMYNPDPINRPRRRRKDEAVEALNEAQVDRAYRNESIKRATLAEVKITNPEEDKHCLKVGMAVEPIAHRTASSDTWPSGIVTGHGVGVLRGTHYIYLDFNPTPYAEAYFRHNKFGEPRKVQQPNKTGEPHE